MYNDDIGGRVKKPNLGPLKHLEIERKAYEAKKEFDRKVCDLLEKGKL